MVFDEGVIRTSAFFLSAQAAAAIGDFIFGGIDNGITTVLRHCPFTYMSTFIFLEESRLYTWLLYSVSPLLLRLEYTEAAMLEKLIAATLLLCYILESEFFVDFGH